MWMRGCQCAAAWHNAPLPVAAPLVRSAGAITRVHCAGDGRGRAYLPSVSKANITYTYDREDMPLTHVDKGECRPRCGFYDRDLIGKV